MLAFIFCASLMYFLDDYHSPNHITVSLSNAEFREKKKRMKRGRKRVKKKRAKKIYVIEKRMIYCFVKLFRRR